MGDVLVAIPGQSPGGNPLGRLISKPDNVYYRDCISRGKWAIFNILKRAASAPGLAGHLALRPRIDLRYFRSFYDRVAASRRRPWAQGNRGCRVRYVARTIAVNEPLAFTASFSGHQAKIVLMAGDGHTSQELATRCEMPLPPITRTSYTLSSAFYINTIIAFSRVRAF